MRKEEIIVKYYFIPSESEGEVVIDEEGMRIEFENKLEELIKTYNWDKEKLNQEREWEATRESKVIRFNTKQ